MIWVLPGPTFRRYFVVNWHFLRILRSPWYEYFSIDTAAENIRLGR
jgi:hypothetical protein